MAYFPPPTTGPIVIDTGNSSSPAPPMAAPIMAVPAAKAAAGAAAGTSSGSDATGIIIGVLIGLLFGFLLHQLIAPFFGVKTLLGDLIPYLKKKRIEKMYDSKVIKAIYAKTEATRTAEEKTKLANTMKTIYNNENITIAKCDSYVEGDFLKDVCDYCAGGNC